MKSEWQTSALGDVLAVLRNGVNCKQDKSGTGDRISRIESISDAIFDMDKVGYSKLNAHEKERNRLQPGDILFSHINSAIHVGKTAVFDRTEDVYHGVNLLLMRPRDMITPAFLNLMLKYLYQSGYWRSVCKQSVNQASVNQQDIWRVQIRYPKRLDEQQRIVRILDEAFEGISTAKANAEKNLKNARALFESHLQFVFSQRGSGWERVTLETLLERGWIEGHLDGNHGSDYPRKEEFIDDGVPYISANCLDDESIDMSCAKYLSTSRAARIRKGIAKDRDVLFAHNATVGPVAILRTEEEKVILGTSLTYYRCNLKHILPEYLAHYMRSFEFKAQYLQVMRQSTRNQVPITKQREFWHVIPPIEDQKWIITSLDGLLENGKRLASIYKRKLAALDALKQSLLHEAFSGNL